MADAAADEPDEGGSGRFWTWVWGAVSLVGGFTWILLHVTAPPDWKGIAVGAVLALGGLVLLMPHRVRLKRGPAWLVALGTAVAGTLAGLLVSSSATCCAFAFSEGRGFPYVWLSRLGTGDSPDTARRIALSAGWAVEATPILVNLFLWAYAGLLIVTVTTLLRRRR
jgi:ABC-type amino acid transport system permease subunit